MVPGHMFLASLVAAGTTLQQAVAVRLCLPINSRSGRWSGHLWVGNTSNFPTRPRVDRAAAVCVFPMSSRSFIWLM